MADELTDHSVLDRPKLRQVDQIEDDLDGERVVILRDPMGVSESFALDVDFAPVLKLFDGTRTLAQIRQSLLMRGAMTLDADDLRRFVTSLSEAGWLDDPAFAELWASVHAEFIETDPRAPRHAGLLYPEHPPELRTALRGVLGDTARTRPETDIVGVLAPHGPLELVGEVLDSTLRDLPTAAHLDTVVVLGTDHGLGLLPYAVARRGFATPLGVVPADLPTLDALERRVDWVRREEIRHRDAHSIELALLPLQAIYGSQMPPIVPVLCSAGVLRGNDPSEAERFVAVLEGLLEGRRALVWGSAELSHAGPAYGRPALTDDSLDAIALRDRACLDDLVYGRTRALASRCREDHPQGRPSGGAVMTTVRQLLPDARAELASYTQRKSPGESQGRLGLAGVRFRRR